MHARTHDSSVCVCVCVLWWWVGGGKLKLGVVDDLDDARPRRQCVNRKGQSDGDGDDGDGSHGGEIRRCNHLR